MIVEPLPSSKIDGIAFWLDMNSPVIGLSLRYNRIDNFWFVLRHEIEHILEGYKDTVTIDLDLENTPLEKDDLPMEEKIANSAASEFCVHQAELENFIANVAPFFLVRRFRHLLRNREFIQV